MSLTFTHLLRFSRFHVPRDGNYFRTSTTVGYVTLLSHFTLSSRFLGTDFLGKMSGRNESLPRLRSTGTIIQQHNIQQHHQVKSDSQSQ